MNVGEGVYTLAEAAALVEIPRRRLGRWVNGYHRGGVEYPPLWRSTMVAESDGEAISFADLMEARMVAAFHETGVPIPTLREAIERAQHKYGVQRPLSSQRFLTDGRRLFAEISDPDAVVSLPERRAAGARKRVPAGTDLVDIGSRQQVFRSVVAPTFRNVDYEGDDAVRWWPLGERRAIVVDPSRSFGRPIDAASGVPTRALADALGPGRKRTVSHYRNVARLYDVPEKVVREADRFAQRFAA